MSIDPNIIKLRKQSGAGILECKKAMEEANGDIEKAQDILRKSGIAKAAKRAGREASEGVIKVAVNEDKTKGYIVEFNSETDFVAKNKNFQIFVEEAFNIFKSNDPKSLDEFLDLKMANSNSIKDSLESLSGVIGEKLEIKGSDMVEGSTVAAYSHMSGKIGVLVALDKSGENELAYDIAMHIAASNPKYLSQDDIPAEEIEREKNIYREQLKKEGKSEDIIEKILEGKINKYFEEVCLLKQKFIKNEELTIDKLLANKDARVLRFVRFSLDSGSTSC